MSSSADAETTASSHHFDDEKKFTSRNGDAEANVVAANEDTHLRRSLSARQVQMIAIGI